MAGTSEAAGPPEALVTVRVLPIGDGRIFTGALAAGVFVTHRRGDVFEADLDTALALEARGLAEAL